nr:hypothetical protein [Tanacetum cinerariifolium]
ARGCTTRAVVGLFVGGVFRLVFMLFVRAAAGVFRIGVGFVAAVAAAFGITGGHAAIVAVVAAVLALAGASGAIGGLGRG